MLNDILQASERYYFRLKNWWQTAKNRSLIKYFRDQIHLDKIIPALMVLGWFGYIPYFFTGLVIVGVPLVVARRHTILGRVKGLVEAAQEGSIALQARLSNLAESLRQRSGRAVPLQRQRYQGQSSNPDSPQARIKAQTKARLKNWAREKGRDFYKNWVRHILPVYLFFTFALAPAFFAIYGYYRIGPDNFLKNAKELGQHLLARIQSRMRWIPPRVGETVEEHAQREAHAFRKRIILMGVLAAGAAALFSFGFGGIFVGLFNATLSTALFMAPMYGAWLFTKDCFFGLVKPLKFGTLHTGVFLGAMSGRAWANALFFGTLTGQVTRMLGQIYSTSLLTMAASSVTQTVPEGLKFIGFRPAGAVSSIIDALSSQHVVMGAEFSGYAGPTTDALFMFMLVGGLYGYVVHQISKLIYNELKVEAASIYNEAVEGRFRMPQVNNLLFQHRWSLAWAASVLLYTFGSPLTPVVMSIFGGSSLIALPVVGLGLAATIAIGKRYGNRLEAVANRTGTRISDFFTADPTLDVERYVEQELQAARPNNPAEDPLNQLPPRGVHFDFSVREPQQQLPNQNPGPLGEGGPVDRMRVRS
jgi:hypothetical protein